MIGAYPRLYIEYLWKKEYGRYNKYTAGKRGSIEVNVQSMQCNIFAIEYT